MSAVVVRVVFTRSRTVGSVLLRTALWSAWSHCALIIGDDIVEAAAFGGVRVRPLADLLRHSSEFEVIEIPVHAAEPVIHAAMSQVGKRYDWLGVLGIGVRRRWQSPRRWFCSELVAWAFAAGGAPLVRVAAWRVTPRDLYLPVYQRATLLFAGKAGL